MANPDPEIKYEIAREARPDVIVGTGRSDYPNQINNVLGFPFIFRGALDVRASTINEDMKLAASHALSALARNPSPTPYWRLTIWIISNSAPIMSSPNPLTGVSACGSRPPSPKQQLKVASPGLPIWIWRHTGSLSRSGCRPIHD